MPGLTPSGRRSFTNAEKIEFVKRWNACVERGAKTALLRECQLNHKTVERWLEADRAGQLGPGVVGREGGRRVDAQDRARLVRLEQENERLRRKVEAAEAALVIMGKAHELLEGTLKSSEPLAEVPATLLSVEEYAAWLTRSRIC